jgi:uncharacterized protein (DUF1501 family)
MNSGPVNSRRRRFLRAAAAGGVAYAFGRTPGTVYAQVAGTGGFNDYKALVCLFMLGGNDAWNMLAPTSPAEYNEYFIARSGGTTASLAQDRAALLPLAPFTPLPNGLSLGLYPNMGGVRQLFQAGRAAFIANVGPLIRPTSLENYQTPGWDLPPGLFSHNDQQDQWHSLGGKALLKSGWAGRIADVLASQVGNQQLPMNISLSGQTLFQAGSVALPYVMGTNGATGMMGLGGTVADEGRRAAFEAVASGTYNTIYERGFAAVQKRTIQFADLINTTLGRTTIDFPSLPDAGVPLSSLQQQLRTVAKLIAQRNDLGMSRQIFFVAAGGFDGHDRLLIDQPGLLGNISASLKSFYDALTYIGMQDAVTTFTHSDFGRSLTSNGDGCDHAWGGNQIVVGGAVRGGEVYGQYPRLALGGPLDIGGGRLIPTTSADQYAATLARWFGVSAANLPQVAPNVNNFAQPLLGFL